MQTDYVLSEKQKKKTSVGMSFELPERKKDSHSNNKEKRQFPLSEKPLPIEKRKEAIKQFDGEEVNDYQQPILSSRTQLNPTLKYLLHSAFLLVKSKDFDLATNLFLKALEIDAHQTISLRWLGHCYHKLNRFNEALVCYREWAKIEENEFSLAALAEILYLTGKDEESLSLYYRALDMINSEMPILFDIYKNIGNIYVKATDYELAEEFYNKAYTLNPDSDVLLVNYGTLEIQRGDLDKALDRFRAAIKVNDRNDRAWIGLALIHRNFGDIDLAWANLEKALDCSCENSTGLQLISQWSVQDHRYDSAIVRLQEYLLSHPIDGVTSYLLAQVLCASGRLEDALLELTRTLSIDPKNEEAEAMRVQIKEYFTMIHKG